MSSNADIIHKSEICASSPSSVIILPLQDCHLHLTYINCFWVRAFALHTERHPQRYHPAVGVKFTPRFYTVVAAASDPGYLANKLYITVLDFEHCAWSTNSSRTVPMFFCPAVLDFVHPVAAAAVAVSCCCIACENWSSVTVFSELAVKLLLREHVKRVFSLSQW